MVDHKKIQDWSKDMEISVLDRVVPIVLSIWAILVIVVYAAAFIYPRIISLIKR